MASQKKGIYQTIWNCQKHQIPNDLIRRITRNHKIKDIIKDGVFEHLEVEESLMITFDKIFASIIFGIDAIRGTKYVEYVEIIERFGIGRYC